MGIPKALVSVAGQPLVAWAFRGLVASDVVDHCVVVIPDGYRHEFDIALKNEISATSRVSVEFVVGGAQRQESVARGLSQLQGWADSSVVLVHDAARCGVPPRVISTVVNTVTQGENVVVPVVPVVDSLRSVTGGSVNRYDMRAVQTPQGFRLGALREAHATSTEGATDDASLAESAGYSVALVDGDPAGHKITTGTDLITVGHLLQQSHDDQHAARRCRN